MKSQFPLIRMLGLALGLSFGLAITPCRAVAQDSGADNDLVRRALHVCAACHGDGGNSTSAEFPKLAGQQVAYTIAQLQAFRSQKRAEEDTRAYMWGVSALLDDTAIAGLAEFYAAQPAPSGKPADPVLAQKGRQIYTDGLPAKGVRACRSCHGDEGEGVSVFPRIGGQHASYILSQLQIFGTRLRPHGAVMAGETKHMTVDEMRAVAEYVQSR
jgi:cytochrome c553